MKQAQTLRNWQVTFMAFCTGLIVANIYYCQPLVILISKEFGVAESRAGTISFCTQLGYALGLFFFVPLGDKLERRKQILTTAGISIGALLLAALAPSLFVLQVACVLIGCTSIVPQLILPLAAHLSLPEKRGKVVGVVMSGLLIGILLSRTISGFVGAWLGWRAMFWIAAGITGSLLILMRLAFPQSRPSFTGNYSLLMRSLPTLLKDQALLREAVGINALTFVSFGMFWTTMVLHLSGAPFYYRSDTIGLFGLAAAAGALLAPLIGGIADKGSPRIAIGYGLAMVAISFAAFYFFGSTVAGMITGIVLLDLGQQSVHVSNQARIYTLLPEARNRINTVYMTLSFLGTSAGSAVGLFVWDRFGWTGICIMGIIAISSAFIVYASTYKRAKSIF